ncbi:MAG: hypothetical protein LIO59_01970 [Oscillospiraceae bacterium]|nr:hypothetical protein [Oscillospiraceae bacterium]
MEKSLAGTDSLSTLKEGTDYYISYNATDPINVGTYPVTIRGIGDYAGYLGTVTYTITAKDINNEDNSEHSELETVNTEIINEDSLIYYSLGGVTLTTSGDDKTLSIEYNGNTLTEGTDFDITYSDNTSVVYSGSEIVKNATAKITGTGNYSGETVVTYAVLPKSIAEGTHGIVFNSSYSTYYTGLPVSVDFFEATDNGVYI